MITRVQLEKAMLEPAAIFDRPEDVLTDKSLTTEQQIEILRRWECQAEQEKVALEEGMRGKASDLLRRIATAMGELTAPLDLEYISPTDQQSRSTKTIGQRDKS